MALTAYSIPSESLGRRILASLGRRFGVRREGVLPRRTVYLDTFDRRVRGAGGSLSVAEDDDGLRLFWQGDAGETLHRLHVAKPPAFAWDLPHGPLRDRLERVIQVRRLLPVVEVEIDARAVAVLDRRDKTIARVVLDHGTAWEPQSEGKRRAMPRTLLVSPLKGYDKPATALLRFIESEFPIRKSEPSELLRALVAVGRQPDDVPGKSSFRLQHGTTAAAATRMILRGLLDTMRLNEAGLRENLDTEFLHDFRVAVRRTRSALGQIKDVLGPQGVARFREEFAWLGQCTGPTRDLDVYLLRMREYRSLLPPDSRLHLDPLESFLVRRQGIEHAKIVAALDSARYAALLREWKAFLDGGAEEPSAPANAGRPVEEVAAERIREIHRKVAKRGSKIRPESPASKLHRLRIDCKKLRYLLEFFGSLFDRAAIRALVKSLKRLQDVLGDFNDLQIQQEGLRRFGEEMAVETGPDQQTSLAMGRLLERLADLQAERRRQFRDAFTRFESIRNRSRFDRLFGARPSVGETS